MVCEALLREGVEVIFGYPGGQIIPLYHVLPEYPLRHVLVRHEQAAAHAADGYARVSGRPGVCFATSGPGATNLVTGLATAYLDSSPVVAVTGQVPTAMLGRSSFQEVDICSIVQSITKGAFLVTDVAEVGPTIRKAFRLARSGRPGPVLVDLPRDVQVAKGNFFYPETPDGDNLRGRLAGDPGQVAKAAALLRRAQRPLLLVGGGVALSGAAAELRRLAEGARLPVVSTLMGLGAFPGSHPLFFGLLGMHGRTYANRALTECDLLLAVGTRLGDRTTGRAAAFGRQATVVHVDVDPAELGKNVHVDVPVVGDVQAVLQSLRAAGPEGEHDGWLATLAAWREAAVPRSSPPGERLQPPAVIEALYHHSQGRAVVVTDVGQHQMWAAQHYVYDRPRSYISSGGLGTMGFGLPAALGAKFGRPQDEVWCVCGDGGLQMNIQEFATLVQEGTAVKVAVLNNGYLGMVRQWQELFYDRRYSSSTIQGPDFVGVARAYGLPARRVTQWEEVPAALKWASETEGPALVEFVVEPEANVYPMVPPGGTLAEVMEG
ncbi:MAG: biosynthetic-type acetolactate synthase large subunit [Chloroflexi bacterium]|nr:biosynthetic-type acetolactate synthase large subunit [Chloroflexota bacterium]